MYLLPFKELIIQIFLKYIKNRKSKRRAIEELTEILAEGKELLGYSVDENKQENK